MEHELPSDFNDELLGIERTLLTEVATFVQTMATDPNAAVAAVAAQNHERARNLRELGHIGEADIFEAEAQRWDALLPDGYLPKPILPADPSDPNAN